MTSKFIITLILTHAKINCKYFRFIERLDWSCRQIEYLGKNYCKNFLMGYNISIDPENTGRKEIAICLPMKE